MQRRRIFVWLMCVGLVLVLASGIVQAGQRLEMRYENTQIYVFQPLDLVLHLFAHLESTGSPASIYDPEYIRWIAGQKEAQGGVTLDLVRELAEFQSQLQEDMTLYQLNFFPVYFQSTEHLLHGFEFVESGDKFSGYIFLSGQEKYLAKYIRNNLNQRQQQAVGEFARVAAEEYESFYREYWEGEEERYRAGMIWFKEVWASDGFPVIRQFFAQHGKSEIRVYLSEGLRVNGRGFGSQPNRVEAAAKMPETKEEALTSYYYALHEMIHQVADPIVYDIMEIDRSQRSVDPADQQGMQIHQLIEMGVVYTQYWLMREISPEMEHGYLEFVGQISGHEVNDLADLEAIVQLPEKVRVALRQVVE